MGILLLMHSVETVQRANWDSQSRQHLVATAPRSTAPLQLPDTSSLPRKNTANPVSSWVRSPWPWTLHRAPAPPGTSAGHSQAGVQ